MCGTLIPGALPGQAAEKVTLAAVLRWRSGVRLPLFLGGAAVYRCDNCIVLNAALAAAGAPSAREIPFPQPAGVTIHGGRQ